VVTVGELKEFLRTLPNDMPVFTYDSEGYSASDFVKAGLEIRDPEDGVSDEPWLLIL
jgi:hypothetical protein